MLFYISNFFGFKYQDESLKNIAIYMSNIYGSNIWVGGLFYGLSQLKNPCGENEWHQYLQNKVIEKTVLLRYVCVCVCVCVGGGGGSACMQKWQSYKVLSYCSQMFSAFALTR